MESLVVAASCVTPMFLYIMLGYAAKKAGLIKEEMCPALNQFCFVCLLSCNLFYNAYITDFSTVLDLKPLVFLFLFVTVMYLSAFPLADQFLPDKRQRGVFVQTAYRSNIAIVGVALAQSLMDQQGVSVLCVTIALIVPFFNILAVIALAKYQGGRVKCTELLKSIGSNPLVVGSALGCLLQLLSVRLPEPVVMATGTLGKTGTTLALILLGAALDFSAMHCNGKTVLCASLIRLFVAPLLALGLGFLLGFRGEALTVILLVSGTPLAAASYAMAFSFHSDAELTGHIVFTTSIASCFSLFLWVWLLKALTWI